MTKEAPIHSLVVIHPGATVEPRTTVWQFQSFPTVL